MHIAPTRGTRRAPQGSLWSSDSDLFTDSGVEVTDILHLGTRHTVIWSLLLESFRGLVHPRRT